MPSVLKSAILGGALQANKLYDEKRADARAAAIKIEANEHDFAKILATGKENRKTVEQKAKADAALADKEDRTLYGLDESIFGKFIPTSTWGSNASLKTMLGKNQITHKLSKFDEWFPYILQRTSFSKNHINHYLDKIRSVAAGSQLMRPDEQEGSKSWLYEWKRALPNISKFMDSDSGQQLISPTVRAQFEKTFTTSLPKAGHFLKNVNQDITKPVIMSEISPISEQERKEENYNIGVEKQRLDILSKKQNIVMNAVLPSRQTMIPYVADIADPSNKEAVIVLSGSVKRLPSEYNEIIMTKGVNQIRTMFDLPQERQTSGRLDLISDGIISLDSNYVSPSTVKSGTWIQQPNYMQNKTKVTDEHREDQLAAGVILDSTDRLEELASQMFPPQGSKFSTVTGVIDFQTKFQGLTGILLDLSNLGSKVKNIVFQEDDRVIIKDDKFNTFDIDTQNGINEIIKASKDSLKDFRGKEGVNDQMYEAAVRFNFEKIKLVYQVAKLIQGGAGGQAVSNMDFKAIKDSFSASPLSNIKGQLAVIRHLRNVTSHRYVMHKFNSNRYTSNTDKDRQYRVAKSIIDKLHESNDNNRSRKTAFSSEENKRTGNEKTPLPQSFYIGAS